MKKLFRIIILILVIIGIIKAIPLGFDYFFPCTYKRQVEECAKKYQVDKNLIFAIIKAESNFNKDAVSKKGAKGLMQLMDETGRWCTEEIGISECELTDVECNINAGTFYFSHLLEMYSGNEKNAIAAYNAGYGNVDKWLEDKNYSGDGKTLDTIPFEETDKYVKKVMLYKKIYSYKDKNKSL